MAALSVLLNMAAKQENILMEQRDGDTSPVGDPTNPSQFKAEVKELRELMELRSSEAVEAISGTYGGVSNLCRRLFTSEHKGVLMDIP